MKDSQSKIHPGSGRRKALEFNKGRQSDDQSIDDLKNLIPMNILDKGICLLKAFT